MCLLKLRPRGRVCVAVRRVCVAAGRVCVAAGNVCVENEAEGKSAQASQAYEYQSFAHKRLEENRSNKFHCQKKINEAQLSIAPVSNTGRRTQFAPGKSLSIFRTLLRIRILRIFFK